MPVHGSPDTPESLQLQSTPKKHPLPSTATMETSEMSPVAALPINENIDFDVCDSGPSGYIAPPKRVRCRGGLKKDDLRTNREII